jgi:cytochrome oxidase Cu insertion factor (SCO1/SenC/PrrC family)
MIVIIAVCVVVLFEAILLLLILRVLGELKQRGVISNRSISQPSDRQGPEIGEYAPSFEGIDQDGISHSLESFRGKYRILAFVAPGCSACSDTIDALNRALQDNSDLQVLVVAGSNWQQNQAYTISPVYVN